GMRGAERIVIALAAFGETRKPAAGAQRADAVAAPGQDLVRIGLMADVPDQAIARGVEDVMDGGGEFHDAQASAEMAAGDGDSVDGLLAKLIGNLPDLIDLEPAQILRRPDGVEKRGLTECGHGMIPVLRAGTFVRARWLHRSGAATALVVPLRFPLLGSLASPGSFPSALGLVARAEARFQSLVRS